MNVLNKLINTSVVKTIGPKVMLAKHYSPEITLALGIATGIAAGIMAVRSARRHEEEMAEIDYDIASVRNALIASETEPTEIYNSRINDSETIVVEPTMRVQLLAPLYGEKFGTFIRLYGPAIAMGGLSVAMFLASHGMLKRRNRILAIALQTVHTGFMQYRKRVTEELGSEADDKFRHGADYESYSYEEVGEDGVVRKRRGKRLVRPQVYTPADYQKEFGRNNPNYQGLRAVDLAYLRSQEEMWTLALQTRGYVYLNEVYRALGYDNSAIGSVVGWAMADNCDPFVSFGLDRHINSQEVMGKDGSWILDFNVAGSILEYID